ncbi:mas-related G-protein coupled receptor member X1-like [Macrotis lagotis]|uniref:mas-related G-protein coupled receptor member X1-like n=1 Tax=Macrotis lagotis TaxID=92651 RepID=UPI003D691F83
MAASPTPEQLEYIHGNTTERSADGIRKLILEEWMLILTGLISLVGLVGNSLVLWLLGFCMKRNPFSVYVLNLAMADALYLCGILVSITSLFTEAFDAFIMSLTLFFLKYTLYTVGLSLLAAISTERCLSVLFPIWYRCHQPKHMSTVVCTILWALTFLLWGTLFVICLNVFNDFCYPLILVTFAWFLFFIPVMCVSSLALLLRVQCTSQRQQPPRLYLLVLLNVLVFLLCGVPMGILDFLQIHINIPIPFGVSLLLACMNSSANPFIYFFLGRQKHKRRRESLKMILQRALEDKWDLGTGAQVREPLK